MSGRLPILQSLSMLLPENGTKNGTIRNGLSKITDPDHKVPTSKSGDDNLIGTGTLRRSHRKRKIESSRVNGVHETKIKPKLIIPKTALTSESPSSPSKLRLSSLISKLSERTSQNHDNISPVKRTRRHSSLYEQRSFKKRRLSFEEPRTDCANSDCLEPECCIEIVESEELSDSQRLMTLAVAKIINLEQELEFLSKRFVVNKIPFNDDSVRVYTGLPNVKVFDAVYDKMKPMVLRFRCQKEKPIMRIFRKYRRMNKRFARAKRLNLKDEFMIAMMHARNDLDIRDTAKRYGISPLQCRTIVDLWSNFLPHQLEKALLAIGRILPESKWNKVPEYVCTDTSASDTSFESTCSLDAPSVPAVSEEKVPSTLASPELRRLIGCQRPSHSHEGFFDVKANYLCDYCFEFHDTSLELLEHTRSRFGLDFTCLRQQLSATMTMVENNSRDAQEWKCCECGEIRDTLSSFLTHLRLHSKPALTKCSKCDMSLNSKADYEKHMRVNHKHVEHAQSKTYFCPSCCIVVEGEEQIAAHRAKHSKPVGKSPVDDKLLLQNVKLPDKSDLDDKFFQHKNIKLPIPRIHKPGSTELKKVDPPKRKSKSGKKRSGAWKCAECPRSYATETSLHVHKSSAHSSSEVRIKCPFCTRTFAHRVTLKVHMTQHTGEKPHKCSYCEKSFFRKNDLYNHERIHTGEKPYSCQYCGAKFAHSCSLAAHVRQSCTKIPNKCEICGYTCDQRIDLQTHMKTHSSEDKYRCNICGKSFLMRHHLDQHKNIHLKKYPCISCNGMFQSQDELNEHAKTHIQRTNPANKRTSNKCELCSREFTRRSDLKRHKRRIHSIFEDSPKKLQELIGEPIVKEEIEDNDLDNDDDDLNPLIIAE